MIADAKEAGQIPAGQGGPARYLEQHPDIVRALQHYWINAERLHSLNVLFLEAEERVLRRAQIERQNADLLTQDSVLWH